jgi:hypothetical protein
MAGLLGTCHARIHCGKRKSRFSVPYRGKVGTLSPGGMTELDAPRAVVLDVNRIGDDFNVVRVVVIDYIGEGRADKGLHTTDARSVYRGEMSGKYGSPLL